MGLYIHSTYLVLSLSWIYLGRSGIAGALVWITEPVNLQQCVGHDVNYTWHYDVARTSHVSMMFWLFMGTGSTIIGWQDNEPTTVYPAYRGRVQLLAGYNAGIQLFDVTKADSGEYKLEISGPGVVTETSVVVYSEDELSPIIEVDGIRVNRDKLFRFNISHKISFKLITGSNLIAESIIFMLDTEENPLHICHNQSVCEFDGTNFTPGNVALLVTITYSFCSPVQESIYMEIIGEATVITDDTAIIIAVVGALLAVSLLVFIVFIILKCRIQANKSKMKEQTKYSEGQTDVNNVTELEMLNESGIHGDHQVARHVDVYEDKSDKGLLDDEPHDEETRDDTSITKENPSSENIPGETHESTVSETPWQLTVAKDFVIDQITDLFRNVTISPIQDGVAEGKNAASYDEHGDIDTPIAEQPRDH